MTCFFNKLEDKSKFVLSVLLILAITAIVILALVTARTRLPQNQFSVSASGKVYARPDIANLTIGLKTEAKPSAAEAVKDNTQKMNEIVNALKNLDIEDKDIQTTNYSLNPVYDWTEKTGQKLKGYEVSQNVNIKIRDLDKIGSAIARTAEKGANQVGNINFTIDDEFKIKNEARTEAIAKAKEKAESIAVATGMKLKKIVNVYENQVFYPGPVNYAKEMSYGLGGSTESLATPSIQAGQNEIVVEVTVVWEID